MLDQGETNIAGTSGLQVPDDIGEAGAGNDYSHTGESPLKEFLGAVVEAIDALYLSGSLLKVGLRGALLADGTPLAKFTDQATSSPGLVVNGGKNMAVRWNDAATQTAIFMDLLLPADMDVTQPAGFLVRGSKTGATMGDATTFDISVWEQLPGDADGAGPTFSGTTNAFNATATANTIQDVLVSVEGGTFALPTNGGPATATVSLQPHNGTLGTDDALVNSLLFFYTKVKPTAP